MLVSSERFGDLEYDESATIEFPFGLLGFEDEREFVLIPEGPDGVYSWLQSLRSPWLAFLAASPHFFWPDYSPEVDDADLAVLQLRDESETHVICLITIDGDKISANLLGPIIVNTRTRVARQVVLSENRWSTREPLGVG